MEMSHYLSSSALSFRDMDTYNNALHDKTPTIMGDS
jgi:hypothetical protein